LIVQHVTNKRLKENKPMRQIVPRSLLIVFALLLVACGSVSEPIWEIAGTETRTAEVAAQQATEIALGLPTSVPPTSTPVPTATPEPTAVPPTATPEPTTVPPTATPEPTATAVPAVLPEGFEALPVGFAEQVANGDAAAGEAAFNLANSMPDGAVWACSQCHSVVPEQTRLIGPGLWNLNVRARDYIEGVDGLTYIYNSILYPNAYIVPPDASGAPYPENLMPQGYPEVLSDEDLVNIIAYLETLQG
jgi:cytochrome c2